MPYEEGMLRTKALAKINLYLHVTGRRSDGYHLLDSLVAFADVGDSLTLEPARAFSFSLDGPMAGSLKGEGDDNNLVVRAAQKLSTALGRSLSFKLSLIKNLPVASGIGGGSSDAAAALRLMASHWKLAPDAPLLYQVARSLGQDVSCCLASESCVFQGIGDEMTHAPSLPYTDIVLVNPSVAVPTPEVFKMRKGSFSLPAEPWEKVPQTACELADLLGACRNDLAQPACQISPVIDDVLAALMEQEGVLLSRMSGSGATCFAFFADRGAAKRAAASLYQQHPDWWVVPTHIPSNLPRPLSS
ncbi:MAG TPA: 4-(cytidine 5'-diphospho)-2-C-methyl-D-erythritol kinase [Rhodospirillaceae bacterium]|nr:4-(cytidine 5'-diphospho)-2-C-methyl-D-erythritol kinase [Rhodospirillaceae bacterium]